MQSIYDFFLICRLIQTPVRRPVTWKHKVCDIIWWWSYEVNAWVELPSKASATWGCSNAWDLSYLFVIHQRDCPLQAQWCRGFLDNSVVNVWFFICVMDFNQALSSAWTWNDVIWQYFILFSASHQRFHGNGANANAERFFPKIWRLTPARCTVRRVFLFLCYFVITKLFLCWNHLQFIIKNKLSNVCKGI